MSVSGSCTPDSGSVLFDVKNPPSLSATATSAVSITQGSAASFSLNIQNSGETTAKFGTITASGGSGLSLSDCAPSDISGSQSLGLSCTITASSSATPVAQTLTISITPSNADSITKTISVTVSASGGDDVGGDTGSSSGGGGASGGAAAVNKKNVTHKPVPPGIMNNTKLQAAIEKVLAKGKLSPEAIGNLMRLSNAISSESTISRTINSGASKSNVTTKIKYTGLKAAKNFVVYEKVPKTFANSSDLITVTAAGAKVEVVLKDPEYAIVFDTVNPNQELEITYSVSKSVSTNVVDLFASEVYAESLADAQAQQTACAQVITPAKNQATGECKEFPTPCDVPSGWDKVDSCKAAATPKDTVKETAEQSEKTGIFSWTLILDILIALVVIAVGYYFFKKKNGSI
ncbi:MAG: hypothetical protein KKE71_01950 [Nanoarchaeota archaeon]|nr:hypothetical protein [Nanoarchaeota archaeon]